jgi:beta-glucosidase
MKYQNHLFLIIFLFISQFSIAEKNVEQRINDILSQMTLKEKIGQLNQLNARFPNQNLFDAIKAGQVGSVINVEDSALLTKMQRIAVRETRLGIPLLIGRDVIHGYKTIFPIPLGQAATFNTDLVKKGGRVAATEATEAGIKWAFGPMMDISRDARWGRIAESFGEDTYLTTQLAVAVVDGYQDNNLSNSTSMAACAKHLVGYGAAEGGRDYNSTNIPERQLRNVYLPPFEASIKAGCASVMTSFNDNDGIPSTGNKFLLNDILRKEWNFDGVVLSDWYSVKEMINHGFCKDDSDAAETAINAGLDMDMVSEAYLYNLENLVKSGKVLEETIDNAVRNILRLKFRLNLFEQPFAAKTNSTKAYSTAHLQVAQQAASESFVLLKNENNTLPFKNSVKKIAIIGPMADAAHDQLGTWSLDGEKSRTITPYKALTEMYGNQVEFLYEKTLGFSRDKNKSKFKNALKQAKKADVIVAFIGEESILTGEAHSLAELNLQGVQSDLIKELKKTGKPLVLVIMAGRPLTIMNEVAQADAVLYVWHPGTMGGSAIADMLFGKTNPSGKLPVTFPKYVGQIPFHYNHNMTGRPASKSETLLNDIPLEPRQSSLGCTSYYLDAGFDPLFPFGFGLSYSSFEYSNLQLSATELTVNDSLKVKATIKNTSNIDGYEVVQLYVRDLVGSIARPVKELKGFQKILLKAGESKTVEFNLKASELAFYGLDLVKKTEPGEFDIWIGESSVNGLKGKFTVK